MSDIDYAERVQRGIALLDQKWPAWATEIDLDTLDISSGTSCMTAQYAQRHANCASYLRGQQLLTLSDSAYEAHGFNADGQSTGETDGPSFEDYAALNGLWKAAIVARRAQTPPEASER